MRLLDKMGMDDKYTVKPFGFIRGLDYFKVQLYLLFKQFMEYKLNAISGIFEQLFYFLSFFFFFSVFTSNFSDVISWSFADYLLFALLTDLILVINGLFIWGSPLKRIITNGLLNQYLVRPVNVWFAYQTSYLSTAAVVFILANLFILPIVIIYFADSHYLF
jgi:ABC-type uncharacterized transport system permease subunit